MKFFCLILTAIFLLSASAAFTDDGATDLETVRRAIQDAQANWTAADNPISRLSPAQKRSYLGYWQTPVDPSRVRERIMSVDVPPSLDWRNHGGNFVTPIRDQLLCGSCWAFAAVAVMESRNAIASNTPDPPYDLSEQHIVSCSGSTCDGGGNYEMAYDYIQDYGVPDENCFPYQGVDLACSDSCDDWKDRVTRIKEWSFITESHTDDEALKAELMNGPVATTLDIYTDFYYYGEGVYTHVSGDYLGGHGVLLIGWDDDQQAWIIKNSWGESWGQDGFGLIKFGEVNIGAWSASISVDIGCNGCFLEGRCRSSGELNNLNTCQACKPSVTTEDWSPVADATPCNDGEFCNGADQCVDGQCGEHAGDPCHHDDGIFCNGVEYCDYDTGSCTHSGDPCVGGTCDEANTTCLDEGAGDDDDDGKSKGGCGG